MSSNSSNTTTDVKETSRKHLISAARNFLENPKVRNAPLEQKVQFLRGKGLSDEEIQEAISSCASLPPLNTRSSPVSTSNIWVWAGLAGFFGSLVGSFVALAAAAVNDDNDIDIDNDNRSFFGKISSFFYRRNHSRKPSSKLICEKIDLALEKMQEYPLQSHQMEQKIFDELKSLRQMILLTPQPHSRTDHTAESSSLKRVPKLPEFNDLNGLFPSEHEPEVVESIFDEDAPHSLSSATNSFTAEHSSDRTSQHVAPNVNSTNLENHSDYTFHQSLLDPTSNFPPSSSSSSSAATAKNSFIQAPLNKQPISTFNNDDDDGADLLDSQSHVSNSEE